MCLEYAVLSGQTRGEGTSRIEAFSDGVFAFALTLLVVSLEPPRSYDELLATIWIWVEHYRFFRAYRIADGVTILLNSLLLFVVLFYVYPLKFMFTFLSHMFFGIAPPRDRLATFGMSVERSVDLLLIYGLGFIAIFAVFTLLHWRVHSQADALALSAAERREARIGLRTHLLSAIVGLVSVGLVLTLPPHRIGFAGMFYAVLGPLHAWHAWWSRRAILESA
jgi:uncharacterized membrane protein